MCPLIASHWNSLYTGLLFSLWVPQGPTFPLNPLDWFNYVDYILFHCLLVPVRGPYIHYHRAIDYSKIWIKWEKLSPKYVRGILRGYRIYYTTYDYKYKYATVVGNITVGPHILEMTIMGLRANTYYHVWVEAFTSKGEGSSKNMAYIKTSKSFLAAGNVQRK